MPDTGSIPKIHVREYPQVVKRGKLGLRHKEALRERQDGLCNGCGIKPKRWEYDHINPLWGGGTQSSLDDWQALGSRDDCKCHQAKTSAEAKDRAKMKRLRGLKGQRARREKRDKPLILSRGFSRPSSDPAKIMSAGWPAKGTRKIASRGFQKRAVKT
jgi:hypothetical protein